jgi:hypothetical protein
MERFSKVDVCRPPPMSFIPALNTALKLAPQSTFLIRQDSARLSIAQHTANFPPQCRLLPISNWAS